MTKAKNYIDGVWTEAGDDGIPMFDPATGEQIGLAPRGTKDDIDRAVAAAKKALSVPNLLGSTILPLG